MMGLEEFWQYRSTATGAGTRAHVNLTNGNLVWNALPMVNPGRGLSSFVNVTYNSQHRLEDVVDLTNPTLREYSAAGDTTSFGYDAAGNQTSLRSPLGNDPNRPDPDQSHYTTTRGYNGDDQLTKITNGLGKSTTLDYDADGNQIRVTRPSAPSSPGGDPQRRVKTITYDGRDLPWQTTAGSGDNKRTTVTEYDANGNLRRTVNPAGVDKDSDLPIHPDDGTAETTHDATVNEYSSDNVRTGTQLPWGGQDQRRLRQDFSPDSRGRIEKVRAPYDSGDGQAARVETSYGYYDSGWVAKSTDPPILNPVTHHTNQPTFTYTYDHRGLQTRWESDQHRSIDRSYYPNGMLKHRDAAALNEAGRSYDYAYDADHNVKQFVDNKVYDSESSKRTTNITYDTADRPKVINENRSAGNKDTTFSYDADGNVLRRQSDGQVQSSDPSNPGYQNGKTTSFGYDSLDRETQMVVNADGEPSRTFATRYWDTGDVRSRTRVKDGGADIVDSFYYNDDGRMARMQRQQNGASTFLKDQGYDYNANGQRSQDERGSYTYNARDQVTGWTRGSKEPHAGSEVLYQLDGSGNVTRKTDPQGPDSSYTYNGGRLEKTLTTDTDPNTGTPQTTTASYEYDDLGSTTKIRTDGPGQSGDPTTYTYDAFERTTKAHQPDDTSSGPTFDYSYDALDRRDKKTKENSTTSYAYAYIGLSNALSREDGVSASGRTYDYDANMDRVGFYDKPAPDAGDPGHVAKYLTYSKDANGNVEGLEDASGRVDEKSKYHYDPYGDLQSGDRTDAEKKLTPEAQDNPFRYEGFYYDSAVKTYDMKARQYRPNIGRFLTQDRFESGQGDYNLQADPLTQNRYAFAGGDPVNNIEFDGHKRSSSARDGALYGSLIGYAICGRGCGVIGGAIGGAIGGYIGGDRGSALVGDAVGGAEIGAAVSAVAEPPPPPAPLDRARSPLGLPNLCQQPGLCSPTPLKALSSQLANQLKGQSGKDDPASTPALCGLGLEGTICLTASKGGGAKGSAKAAAAAALAALLKGAGGGIKDCIRTGALRCLGGAGRSATKAESEAAEIGFGHGARHLGGTGLAREDVEAAIEHQVRSGAQGATVRGSFGGRVTVGGKTIEYRGHGLEDGKINIGTYYPPR